MGTVTAYNLSNVQAALGGVNPIYLSEYYRGGAYVPTTRNVLVYEPAGGGWAGISTAAWYDVFSGGGGKGDPATYVESQIIWQGYTMGYVYSQTTMSVTLGAYTYYKGPIYSGGSYYMRRTSAGTQSINTSVPSSGAISLSQLLGAANP